MSYRINRTDGELIVDLTDGIVDETTTDLTLIGKNYKGFGEFLNENFVKLLENFASTSNPTNPLTGQLWYDKQDQKLKVFDGTQFRSASGTIVNSSQPTNLIAGDIWIDNENNRLYLFDGTDLTLVGPTYNAGQGKTGFETDTQVDTNNITHVILKLFIGGQLYGVYSPETFIVPINFAIPGYSTDPDDIEFPPRQKLYKGFNVARGSDESGTSGFWYNGTATSAKGLIDDVGNIKTAENFMASDGNATTIGSLKIKNSAGLSVGVGDSEYVVLKVTGNTSILECQQINADFALRVRQGSSFINPIYVDASSGNMGVYTTAPTHTLDVNGDMQVRGSLYVQGDSAFINTTTLRVLDKNIELGLLDDSTEGDDVTADGGGIILRSSNSSKDLIWNRSYAAWSSNQNFNLTTTPVNSQPCFMIDGTKILDKDELNVRYAFSLERVGVLSELTIDDLYFDGNSIQRINGTGLYINVGGPVTLNNLNITGLATPVGLTDATHKDYVDTLVNSQQLNFQIDATGLTDPNDISIGDGPINSIRSLIELLRPASTVEAGTVAKILVTSYDSATVQNIPVTVETNNTGTLQISYIPVRDQLGTGIEAVVQDIAANSDTSGTVQLIVVRYIYEFNAQANIWTYVTRTIFN